MALRLRKRKSGTSQTHKAKKVAMSANAGACWDGGTAPGPRYCLGARCCASRDSFEKKKNQEKWFASDKKHDAMKESEESDICGQELEKFCR